jgi:hypothetical protein
MQIVIDLKGEHGETHSLVRWYVLMVQKIMDGGRKENICSRSSTPSEGLNVGRLWLNRARISGTTKGPQTEIG